MLVYGVFNAAVETKDMKDGLEYDAGKGVWCVASEIRIPYLRCEPSNCDSRGGWI